MNEENKLKTLLPALQSIVPLASDSTMRLLALARIYTAIYGMIVTNDADDEFGDRSEYTSKADKLFRIMLHKADKTRDLAKRSELVSALFTLTEGTSFIRDEKRMNACYNAVIRLMQDYEQNNDTNPLIQASICRCLIPFFAPEKVEDDEWFILLYSTLNDWIDSQSANGSWKDLSPTVALRRIEVMNSYSCAFLDHNFDVHTQLAYDFYRAHISTHRGQETFISKERLQILGELYGMSRQGNTCPINWELANKVTGIMEQQCKAYPFGSDGWLYCGSLLVEDWCEKKAETFNLCCQYNQK